MADIEGNLNFYKTPSCEILQYRKEFYGLSRRSDDQTATWMKLVQSHINRCKFPPLISREYLLIDRFICNLNSNAKEFVQSVDTWTLQQLNEYFVDQNIVTDHRVNVTILIDATTDQQSQQNQQNGSTSTLNGTEFECVCLSTIEHISRNYFEFWFLTGK